ncbi:MAG: Glucose-6-phosphate isomerase [Eubacteriales bacterium SKADARSKE-1]|nr:Glucose-6-phosphate isomerase [Eubacteriales bacterium SKADARSKE-1]
MATKLNTKYLDRFISDYEYESISPFVRTAHDLLHSKTGLGNEFTGWVELPTEYDKDEFDRIKTVAKKIQDDTDIFIVIGIGGSYLGARAVIEFLKSQHYNALYKTTPDIYFAGNNICPENLNKLIKICAGRNVSINMISKSGATTEPAIAFRVFKKLLEDKYGKEEAKKRIYCTTDAEHGNLKNLADKEGYETFVIPNDVGGRYSVLTAVGLLPIAVAGIDIDNFMLGAKHAQDELLDPELNNNDCYKYAAIRNILYKKGKEIEILESYDPNFSMMSEWFKQLFGESEGKDGKGLFPASMIFSTDLHSMGQLIQDGRRNIFETVLLIDEPHCDFVIDTEPGDLDGLNFLSGKTISYVCKKAAIGTILAHTEGNVPNIIFNIPKVCEFELGYLIYFLQKACAISGYLLGVNPFNQPGVEKYKKNMFELLGKS